MKVYRVEIPTEKGGWCGPYQPWDGKTGTLRTIANSMGIAHGLGSMREPASVYDDYIFSMVDCHYFSGCPSMRDLFAWFGGWLPILMRNGARIIVLNVPDERIVVRNERHQCVFDMGE